MEHPFISADAKAGMIGGTILVLLFKISSEDLLVSALLAAVGAAVSFVTSVFLKFILRRFRRK